MKCADQLNSRNICGRGESSLATLGGREHHCELKQTPGPDRQGQQHQDGLLRDLFVLEGIEELDYVRSCANVHKQQLRQLVSGQIPWETEQCHRFQIHIQIIPVRLFCNLAKP